MSEMILNLHVEKLPEGCYVATSSDMPGLVAQGRTINETIGIAQDIARKLVESYQEHGDRIPLVKPHKVIDLQVAVGVS